MKILVLLGCCVMWSVVFGKPPKPPNRERRNVCPQNCYCESFRTECHVLMCSIDEIPKHFVEKLIVFGQPCMEQLTEAQYGSLRLENMACPVNIPLCV